MVQHVDATKAVSTGSDYGCALRFQCHVGLKSTAFAASLLHQSKSFLCRIEISIHQQHRGALFCKSQGRGPTIANGCARRLASANNDSYLVRQTTR